MPTSAIPVAGTIRLAVRSRRWSSPPVAAGRLGIAIGLVAALIVGLIAFALTRDRIKKRPNVADVPRRRH